MLRRSSLLSPLVVVVLLGLGLGVSAAGCETSPTFATGTHALLQFDEVKAGTAGFFDAPFPSDLRTTATGELVYDGFPALPTSNNAAGFLTAAKARKGAPLMAVTFVRFSAPIAPLVRTDVIDADAGSAIFLVDIDDASPEKGRLRPLVAETLATDAYAPANVIAVAPVPGFLLREHTTYALVITTELRDAHGDRVQASTELAAWANVPSDPHGAAYAKLWAALPSLGRDVSSLAAATVFTTGDPFEETRAQSDAVLADHVVAIDPKTIALVTDPTFVNPDLCELTAKITYPQFQTGLPPYDTDGVQVVGPDGHPVKQRDDTVDIGFAVPKRAMPAGGFPVSVVIHGTGGYSNSFVSPIADGNRDPLGRVWGLGMAFPFAKVGIASAGSAMPVNKQRAPTAGDGQYVNFNNLPVARYNLTQGIFESRLFVRALGNVRIPAAVLAGCVDQATLGANEVFFDKAHTYITGQSMGGMYTSMVAAVEPALKGAIPTGAGGYFALQFLINHVTSDPSVLIALLLGTEPAYLSQLHPALAVANAAFEPADPLNFVERIAARPPSGVTPRAVLEPAAPEDEYFPPPIYAALAVAYRHPRVGAPVTGLKTVDDALTLAGRSPATYPLAANVSGVASAIVEYEVPAGLDSGHQIIYHRDEPRYQATCFFKTLLETGTAKIVAPKNETTTFDCN